MTLVHVSFEAEPGALRELERVCAGFGTALTSSFEDGRWYSASLPEGPAVDDLVAQARRLPGVVAAFAKRGDARPG